MDRTIRGKFCRRFVGFNEKKGFGDFPLDRIETGSKDEIVNRCQECIKDVRG